METIKYKELSEYKAGDSVEVLVNNPRNENLNEWREGEILDVRTIYPPFGSKHQPFQIAIVRVRRTYCKATPRYQYYGNIPVFIDNDLEFYDKENEEGFIYKKQIRVKL